jgi:prepilin-type N-terminal cleavage/methylation domain-containing protein
MLTPSSHKNGFTLIEVMVAMVIFTIAILGTYKLQLQSTTSNALADRVSTSTTWANYSLEELITRDYDDSTWDDSTDDGAAGLNDTGANADWAMYIRPDGSTTATAAAGDLYSVFWNIDDDAPLVNTKQIRFLVYRNGGIGSGLLYTHDFYKTDEDL